MALIDHVKDMDTTDDYDEYGDNDVYDQSQGGYNDLNPPDLD